MYRVHVYRLNNIPRIALVVPNSILAVSIFFIPYFLMSYTYTCATLPVVATTAATTSEWGAPYFPFHMCHVIIC